MNKYFLRVVVIFFLFSNSLAIGFPPTSTMDLSTTTTTIPYFVTTTTINPDPGAPELPGGSLYLLIGGASGMLFWVRRFFRK